MRRCSRCLIPDSRIILPSEACTCSAGSIYAPDDDHLPSCHMVGHKVIEGWPFPTVMRSRDLTKDPDATHGYVLPAKYRGWRLVERPNHPGQFVRVKTLCRDCITLEIGIAERVKDYEKAKKRLTDAGKPPEDMGWAKMMALQDAL